MQKVKRSETIEIELEDIKTDNGKLLNNLSKVELIELLARAIETKLVQLEANGVIEDSMYEFMSFQIDEKMLNKYSESEQVYPHFVYYYFKNWHVNSLSSRHYTNGGHWQHAPYDPNRGWHHDIIKKAREKILSDQHCLASIRDLILIHFYTGGVIRMYGTNMYYKTVRDFKSVIERQGFFDFILDSGMVSINKKEELRSLTHKVDKYNLLNGSHYNTLGESFLHHCIRHKDIETFKYLVEKKGLDLYEIDKKPFEHWVDEQHTEAYYGHGTSFLYRLIDGICSGNYRYYFQESACPNHWPNGRPVNENERAERDKRIEKSRPMIDFFREMFAYINKKFPKLEVFTLEKFTYEDKKAGKERARIVLDKATAIRTLLKEYAFGSSGYDDDQLNFIQELFFGTT